MERRKALERRSPLKPGKPLKRTQLARTPAATASKARVVRVRRVTGPGQPTRLLLIGRSLGCCELCGRRLHDGWGWLGDHSFHHRQPRGVGGTRAAAINSPANLLLLCGTGTTGCHGLVEAQRAIAYDRGWLVRHPFDPAGAPVRIHPGRVVLLTGWGTYTDTEED